MWPERVSMSNFNIKRTMKKLLVLFVVMAVGVLVVDAQTLEEVYRKLPRLSGKQMLDEKAKANAMEEYSKAVDFVTSKETVNYDIAPVEDEDIVIGGFVMDSLERVATALGENLLGELKSAGIDLEKLEEMSEEDILNGIVAFFAQPNLEPSEALMRAGDIFREKLMGFVDGNFGSMDGLLNNVMSLLGGQDILEQLMGTQMGSVVSAPKKVELSKADQAKVDRIVEIQELMDKKLSAKEEYATYGRAEWNLTEQTNALFDLNDRFRETKFDPVMKSLRERVAKDNRNKAGKTVKMPSYAKKYYKELNQLIDEYNEEVIKSWDAFSAEKVSVVAGVLDDCLPLLTEKEKLYDSLSNDAAKRAVADEMSDMRIYGVMLSYLRMIIPMAGNNNLTERHQEIPKTICVAE